MINTPVERGLILPASERHLEDALARTNTNELGRTLLFGKTQPQLAAHVGDLLLMKGMEATCSKEHEIRHAVRRCFVIGYETLVLSWQDEQKDDVCFPTVAKETFDGYLEDPDSSDRDILEARQPTLFEYAGLVFNGLTRANDRLPVDDCMGSFAKMYGLMEQQIGIEGRQ